MTQFYYSYVSLDDACDTPGCKTVLVLDGNMKNAQQVCMCKHIGELYFEDLEGTVVVGKTKYF